MLSVIVYIVYTECAPETLKIKWKEGFVVGGGEGTVRANG